MRWMAWMSLVALVAACGDDDSTPMMDAGTDAEVAEDLGGPEDAGPQDMGTDAGDPGCTEGCAIVEVSAGSDFACARRENGQVLCWGGNRFGQLGDGSMRQSTTCGMGTASDIPYCAPDPQEVLLVTATAIDSTGVGSCATQADGTLWCWGLTDAIDEGAGERRRLFTAEQRAGFAMVDTFAKAGSHTCAVQDDGSVICAGQNDSGQLGVADFEDHPTPAGVSLADALQVEAGGVFSCARTATAVYCWGDNDSGQLGEDVAHEVCGDLGNQYDCSSTPVEVTFADPTAVESIALGSNHACALMNDTTVQCWGLNATGQAGQLGGGNIATPTEVSGLTDVEMLVAGGNTTCALVTGGTAKCWGANDEGQLGDGQDVGTHETCSSLAGGDIDCSSVPTDAALPEAATDLAVGSFHVCALGESGAVYCWGWNDQRQLGPNGAESRTRSTMPLEVTGL